MLLAYTDFGGKMKVESIQNISVSVREWDEGVKSGKYAEESIFIRHTLELISIECPKCQCHVWQEGLVFLKNEEKRKTITCLVCGSSSSRLVGN